MTSTDYRPELDGLRAIAVIGVLFFHLGLNNFSGGYLGVDVFFVLSGYLITKMIQKSQDTSTFSFINFYIRRARRLLPTMFLVIATTLFFGALLLSPEHLEAGSQSGLYASISVVNIHHWLSAGYFDLSSANKPFLHFWSLSVEEQFYLFWPVLLIFSHKFFKSKGRVACIAIISAASFFTSYFLVTNSPDAVFYLMPFRVWEFGLGAMLALIATNIQTRKSSIGILSIVGLALIIFGFIYHEKFNNYALQYLPVVLGTLLVIGTPLNAVSSLLLTNPVSVYLGKISYSLYLWHWPIIVYIKYYTDYEMSAATIALALALTLTLSSLSYHFVETRFRKPWTTETRLERLAVPAAFMTIISCLVVVTSHGWAQKGWDKRLSLELRTITTASQQRPNPNCDRRTAKNGQAGVCIFGEQGKQVDIAVIGDSHSNVLAAGLVNPFRESKVTGIAFSRGGMGPFLGADHFRNNGEPRGNRNKDYEALLSENPNYVILHARFALYWTTHVTAQDETDLRIYLTPSDTSFDNSVEGAQNTFRRSIEDALIAIQKTGATPVIVGPVPNPGVDVVKCLSRPLFRTLETAMKLCNGYSQEQSYDRTAEVAEFLKTIAATHDGIYVDANPVFCKNGEPTCRRMWKDKLFYRDGNHLSLVGARVLGAEVMKKIQLHKADTTKK